MQGARWAHDSLLAEPAAVKAHLIVIWLPILEADQRKRAPFTEMTSHRAVNVWDGQHIAGRWLFDRAGGLEGLPGVAWDTFYLFPGSARWGDPPLATGHTILKTTDQLVAALGWV